MSIIPGAGINGRPLTVEQYVRGDYLAALLGKYKGTEGRTPAPGFVNFFALDGSADVTVLMANAPATLSGGGGGWNEETRRGLAPVTWWDAPDAYRQSVPVMFMGNSQEAAINDLRSLQRSPGSRRPPPAIVVTGQAVHRADITWVVESIDEGTNVKRRASDGNRVRQDFTVRLLQYNAVDVIAERSPSKQAAGGKHTTKPGRGRTTYRVKAGDRSLAEIAARKDIYGDASQWKRIAKANGIRDPRSLKVGRVLKIPR
jgi:hypothetical protein